MRELKGMPLRDSTGAATDKSNENAGMPAIWSERRIELPHSRKRFWTRRASSETVRRTSTMRGAARPSP